MNASVAVQMSCTECAPLSMCGRDFHFKLDHLVITSLPRASLIFIFFPLLQRWRDGQPTPQFVVPGGLLPDNPPIFVPVLVTCLETYPCADPCPGMLSCCPITCILGRCSATRLPPLPPPLHYGGIHPSSNVITASINVADIPLHGALIVMPCFTCTLQLRFRSYCFYGF